MFILSRVSALVLTYTGVDIMVYSWIRVLVEPNYGE